MGRMQIRTGQQGVVGVLAHMQVLAGLVLLAGLIVVPSPAWAFREPSTNQTTGSVCDGCHQGMPAVDADCRECHTFVNDTFPFSSWSATYPDTPFSWKGPHGTYTAATDRCQMCHTLHDAPSGLSLLPGATVSATCLMCHDGTGGYGVYGAVEARTGQAPGGGHAFEITNNVPGANPATGGSAQMTFEGVGGTLTCSDCHSPHDSMTVEPFLGERLRVRDCIEVPYSNRLLRQKPTGATEPVTVYGSDWCLACHQGRGSGGLVHNHPVDSAATNAAPFYYERVVAFYGGALTTGPQPLSAIGSTGGVGGEIASTHWYSPAGKTALDIKHLGSHLMPYPRVPLQVGHAPICQQCHEDTRDCGELTADGTGVLTAIENVRGRSLFKYAEADGETGGDNDPATPNPRFQNFPHETETEYLLVETGDDLCLNCHPMGQ